MNPGDYILSTNHKIIEPNDWKNRIFKIQKLLNDRIIVVYNKEEGEFHYKREGISWIYLGYKKLYTLLE